MADTSSFPRADKRPTERTHHGDTFVDDYEWMRVKDDPDTVAYLEAENAYRTAQNAHLTGLAEEIFGEIKTRTLETDMSVPSRTRGYWYFSRTTEGKQYPVLCRAKAEADDWTPPAVTPDDAVPGEEVLLDCNELAAGEDFFSLGAFTTTLDDTLLAYSTDVVGDERYTIFVKDLRTGDLLADQIPNTIHGATWSADGTQIYYSTVDESWRPDKIWRHTLGDDAGTDELVYHEADGRFFTSVGRTTSDRFLVVGAHSKVTSEIRILDLSEPTSNFRVVVPREFGVEYHLDHLVVGGIDRLVVLHNKDGENFSLGVGPITMASLSDLDELVAPSETTRLSDVDVSETTLVVNLREGGLAQIRVYPIGRTGLGEGKNIAFDEEIFEASATGFTDWSQPYVRLHYASWVTPTTVYDYDPATGGLHLRKRQPVLGGYDPADYVQTREWVTARDGAQVPLSVIRHKDVEPRSGSPLLLYGYGSYEISIDPYVNIGRLSLLDRGVVYAIAHIRGGGEMGRHWYEQGKLLAKKNTFTDFVDCAEHVVATGWTTVPQLVAHGGSAGGLLVGAVANIAPDAFGSIVAHVPFVDALTTILDPSLPLTEIEWDEWGDPLHNPDFYAYMRSYTPYENIEARSYPAIYAITSINDTRVMYVEPAKWVAKLRDTITNPGDVIFKCEMSAGHGGASGRYDAWREAADYLAWVIDRAGAQHERLHPLSSAG